MRSTDSQSVRRRIGSVLRRLGVPEHMKGHDYLLEAVELAAHDPAVLRKMMDVLYPTVANKYGTTPTASERAMRLAIENAWLRSDPDIQRSYFGGTVDPEKGKPTNSEFIARVSNAVRQEVIS